MEGLSTANFNRGSISSDTNIESQFIRPQRELHDVKETGFFEAHGLSFKLSFPKMNLLQGLKDTATAIKDFFLKPREAAPIKGKVKSVASSMEAPGFIGQRIQRNTSQPKNMSLDGRASFYDENNQRDPLAVKNLFG